MQVHAQYATYLIVLNAAKVLFALDAQRVIRSITDLANLKITVKLNIVKLASSILQANVKHVS